MVRSLTESYLPVLDHMEGHTSIAHGVEDVDNLGDIIPFSTWEFLGTSFCPHTRRRTWTSLGTLFCPLHGDEDAGIFGEISHFSVTLMPSLPSRDQPSSPHLLQSLRDLKTRNRYGRLLSSGESTS